MVALVDQAISREKFLRELERWETNDLHQERGWILLAANVDALTVELAFLAKVTTTMGASPLPVVVCAIRLAYENYDLWPPSLTFIDVFTRQPMRPHVRAIQPTPEGLRDVLIDSHLDTNQPFLCVAGIREYHTHPQHSGDSWLLHRQLGEGTMSTICDRVWRYMVKSVVGINVGVQALPDFPLRANVHVVLAQGEVRETPQPSIVNKPQQSVEN